MEPVDNITYDVNDKVLHKYVEFVQDGKKYVACTTNNTGKLYIIDASKELAITAPYSGTTANGIMSMGVVEVSGKAYVVTTCGAMGNGIAYVHSGSGATWTAKDTTTVGNYSIIGDSTPFWAKNNTASITLRGGYSNLTYLLLGSACYQSFNTLSSPTLNTSGGEYNNTYSSSIVYNETYSTLIIAGGQSNAVNISRNNTVYSNNVCYGGVASSRASTPLNIYLSEPKSHLAGVALDNDFMIFAGGVNENGACDTVDLVKVKSSSSAEVIHTPLKLTMPRYDLAATVATVTLADGNTQKYAIFAGGVNGDVVCNNVDVFWLDKSNVLHKLDNIPNM